MTAHEKPVITLCLNEENTIIATGSCDFTVKIINVLSGKVVSSLDCGKSQETLTDSVESMAFGFRGLLAVGTLRGAIEIWDVSSYVKRSEIMDVGNAESGVSKLLVNPNDPSMLYASYLDGCFRVCDIRTGKVVQCTDCHDADILDFCLSPNLLFAVTCSEDSTAKILLLKQ